MQYYELIQRLALQTLLFSCFVQQALLKPHFSLFNQPSEVEFGTAVTAGGSVKFLQAM